MLLTRLRPKLFHGDGDLDAFVANTFKTSRVWLNDGSGTFSPSGNSLGGSFSLDVNLGDVDGDGDLLLIAPEVIFDPTGGAIFIAPGRKLEIKSIHSLDPVLPKLRSE